MSNHNTTFLFLRKYPILACLFLSLFYNCNSPIKTNTSNEEEHPVLQKEDEVFANVFKILDGTWKGEFLIMEDPNPVAKDQVELTHLSIDQVKAPHLKTINKIKVEQVYTSESPYFQRVTIKDYYPDSQKEDVSQGVNKIENGQLWCIVNKPYEKVIHTGTTRGNNTIIWQQQQNSPQRIEYFQETVDQTFYEIIGYGYYEGDDTNLSPRLWFYGRYERQKDQE